MGQYRILGILGRGGMGAVYRAEDVALARHVAIKILPAELTQPDSERFQRFLREARSAARLNHPNVVTIYQFGIHEGKYFIVMELVEGSTLVDILQRHGPIDARRATNIIVQAVRALGAAHAGGIIHRDVKPGNIMVTRGSGMVKVADFGLAKVNSMAGEITQAGDVVGTPLYMSPEQCRGESADARSDLYSLCMTYYRLVTGVLPFEAENTHATMYKQIHEPLPDPRKYVATIPPVVCAALFKGLAKDPNQRFQDAPELERALLTLDFGISGSGLMIPSSGTMDPVAPGAHMAAGTPPAGVLSGAPGATPESGGQLNALAGAVKQVAKYPASVRIGISHNSVSPGGTLKNLAGRNGWTLAAAALLFAGVSFGMTWVLLGVFGDNGNKADPKPLPKDPIAEPKPKDDTPVAKVRDIEAEAYEQLRAIANTKLSAKERADDLKKKVVDVYPGTAAAADARRQIEGLKREINLDRAAEIAYKGVQKEIAKYDDLAAKIQLLQQFVNNPNFAGTTAVEHAKNAILDLKAKLEKMGGTGM